MTVTVVNLTPHALVVRPDGGPTLRWEPASEPARLDEHASPAAPLVTEGGPVPVVQVDYTGDVEGLPDPQDGVVYVVSRVVAAAVDRPDVLFPQGEVRDSSGMITHCRALGRFTSRAGATAGQAQ